MSINNSNSPAEAFRERATLDQKIKSDLLAAADALTTLGNDTEKLLSCLRSVSGNLRAERPRLNGTDLIELINLYRVLLNRREPVAQAIEGIRCAMKEAAARDARVIDEEMERAGLSQLLVLDALKGKTPERG